MKKITRQRESAEENIRSFVDQARIFAVHLDVLAGLGQMHPTDFVILSWLTDLKTANVGQLAKTANLSSGAATAAIDRLEREGYVERRADPNDRRKVVVKFKSKPEKFSKVERILKEETYRAFDKSDKNEASLTIGALRKVNAIFKNAIDEISK